MKKRAVGTAVGRLLKRIRLRYSKNGEPFALLELENRKTDGLTAHRCVAVGTVAETMAAITSSGALLELRGEVGPFLRVLPGGETVRLEQALKVSDFQFCEEDAV